VRACYRVAPRIARARRRRLARGRCGSVAASARRLSVELAAYVADEVVDARVVEPLLEGGHSFAAFAYLFGEVLVGVFFAVLAQARNFELLAVLKLEGAARAVGLVAADAELRVVGGCARKLVGRGRRGGRRGGRGARVGVGRLVGRRVIAVACGDESDEGEGDERKLKEFHFLNDSGARKKDFRRNEKAARV
jgi:hypothetical protein